MAILLLFLLLILVFSIPAVQTSVARKLTDNLNEKFGTDMKVERVAITYNGAVSLREILILDYRKDTLIKAEQLNTSLLGLTGFFNGNLNFGNTEVEGLDFDIRRYKGDTLDNFAVFTRSFDSNKPNPKPVKISVEHIVALNSTFTYIDENLPSPNVISLDNLNLDASNFEVDGPNISIEMNSMKADESRGLRIEDMSTKFSYSPTNMIARNLALTTPTSQLNAEVVFDYEEGELSDFENKVDLKAVLDNSKISFQDLNIFYEGFGDGNHEINLDGNLTGTLNDLNLENFKLDGINNSIIDGDLRLQGLFSDLDDTFTISGDLNQLSSDYNDLVRLLPETLGDLPLVLRELGTTSLKGYVKVTPSTVETDSRISTKLGTAVLNLSLGSLDDSDFATYKGNIQVRNFDLGRLLKSKSLGETSFNLNVDGRGFTKETLDTNLNGEISGFVFNDYRYKNISVLGVLSNAIFNGRLEGNDPNLKFEFEGAVNAARKLKTYDFDLNIEYADLHALNFVSRDSLSIFKGEVSMDMSATDWNDAVGTVLFYNSSYQNARNTYTFHELKITSSFTEPFPNGNLERERRITINSPDVIDGQLSGSFKLEEIPALFQNSIASLYANYQPEIITTNQYLDFNFNIYNKIVEVFFPEIELAPNTFVRGSMASDDSKFNLRFKSPQITAFGNLIENINLQVDNTNPLFNTFIEVDSVATNFYNISDFSLINVTMRDTLFIRSEFRGGVENNDEFNLSFYHTINERGNSVVGVRRSNFKFKESLWFLNEEKNESNRIVFDDNFRDVYIDSLVMSHKDQEIRMSGIMRDTTYKDIKLAFDKVDLEKITPDMDSLDMRGTVDGKIQILQEKGAYFPTVALGIDDLSINDIPYGDLSLQVEGNEDLTNYSIYALMKDEYYDYLTANGEINVSDENAHIDLEINLQKFKLDAFSPLGKDVISNLRGAATGTAKIMGDYRNPGISGRLILEDAGLRIPYLNVDYDFKDQAVVNLDKQRFVFDNVKLLDTKYETEGLLNGSISHNNFKDWRLDLKVTTDRLLALNTEASETALYYGTAFISGSASIAGPTDELVINVDATTEEGTVFKIPLNDTETVSDASFIYFLSPEEKTAREEGKDIFIEEIKGLSINFDLNVTNDALVEIVVDQVSGSTLRGRGAGILRIEINTNGKFNMWGDFAVYEGVFNFKYAGLVQKEFEVQSGGSINWSGSPARADLNVRAIYYTTANPSILLESPNFNRLIPVEVVISLNGQIVQPDIEFALQYPNLSSTIKSELEYRINDRRSTELQALSLITIRQFYSPGALGEAPAGTLFERASGLVNNLFRDDDGKFSLGFRYDQGERTPEQEGVDRFGVMVSTQISNRLVFKGEVGVPIGGVSESFIFGNAELNFLLNEEGTLRFKVFNRENDIRYIGEDIIYNQGMGLSYTVDFDTFDELVRKIFKGDIKPEEIPQAIEEMTEQESVAPEYVKFPED